MCGDGLDKLEAAWPDSQDVNISFTQAAAECSGLIATVCSGVGKLHSRNPSSNAMREGLCYRRSPGHADGSC